MRTMIPFFLFILLSQTAYTSVWETQNNWNQQYRDELANWVRSSAVHPKMFTDKNSKYYGVNADCADVTYALRAIFSYENKLPFKVLNPVHRRGQGFKYFSNELTKFDRYPEGTARVVKFVNFLGSSLGTETLNLNDSYPIKLSAIKAGTFHAYKKRMTNGYVRHSHNIKDVTTTGNFLLLWSNQQRKKEKLPMKMAEWSRLQNRPYKFKWGFRTVKFPDDFENDPSTYIDYSTEQYTLAKQLDEKEFYKRVKNILKETDEDPNISFTRQLGNLCELLKERVSIIASSEAYRQKIGGRCMDYKEYDEYSTPARDGRFLALFTTLEDTYRDFETDGLLSTVDYELLETVEKVISGSAAGTDQDYCQVQYIPNAEAQGLSATYKKLKYGQLSSHPNDNIHRRWGVERGEETRCKKWY